MRRYSIRRKNNIILGALAVVLITMAGGYAIFSSNLNITGTSNISNNWDIRISKVAGTLGGHAAHALDTNENEINPECDSTTSTPKSCGEGLTVTFSDLFYYEGDSSTYNITLKNSGSLDAALTENVEPVVTTNSDKIHVELTGFKTKGQILAKNNTATTTLTITYATETALADSNNKIKPLSNTKTIVPQLLDNEEEQPEASITITYPFRQDSESGAVTQEKHLVEYDCTTNGGTSCTNYKEYVTTGQSVNLENEGTQKSQYAFLGWNTDKDATEGLSTLTMGNNDIKLYAIYKKDKITFNSVTTTSTTNSITVVARASALSEITKYEYSTDGETYYEGSIDTTNNNSTYTFSGLTQNTSYPIYVKATAKSGVSDVYEVSGVDLTENVVTTGDGLYQDATETDRYIYKGSDPDNYITFNGEKAGWRIYSVESDGRIKIVKDERIDDSNTVSTSIFDPGYSTAAISGIKSANNNTGTRRQGTNTSTYYCRDFNSTANTSYYGCNAWGSSSTTLNSSGTKVASQSQTAGNTSTTYTVPTSESYLNVYLNHQFNNAIYNGNSLSSYYSIGNSYTGYIETATWNIGSSGEYNSSTALATIVDYEKYYKWEGKIGLLTASEYIRANTNMSSCGTLGTLYSNYNTCKSTNYLFKSDYSWWLLSPHSGDSYRVLRVYTSGLVDSNGGAGSTSGVRPALYLSSNTILKGLGTSIEPYYIGNPGADTKQLQTPTFTETETANGKTITIDYHKECGSNGITCTYIKDGETTENLTGSTQTVDFTNDGTLVATISDGTNTVSTSSYTVRVFTAERTISKLNATVVTSGDGLYKDNNENGRYTYRGSNPNNYFTFNGETAGWRTVSVEKDGTIKIIHINSVGAKGWDAGDTRNKSTSTYCTYSCAIGTNCYGCNAWAKTSALATTNSTLSTSLASGTFSQYGTNGGTSGTVYSGTVTQDAYINTYLNETYYKNTLNSNNNIDKHDFYISTPGDINDTESIATDVTQEKLYTWNGYVGLITATDYMRASIDSSCTSLKNAYNSPYPCKNNNYLNSLFYWWTISPYVVSTRSRVWFVNSNGMLNNDFVYGANGGYGVRPALYLKANIKLKGSGTSGDPYYIDES